MPALHCPRTPRPWTAPLLLALAAALLGAGCGGHHRTSWRHTGQGTVTEIHGTGASRDMRVEWWEGGLHTTLRARGPWEPSSDERGIVGLAEAGSVSITEKGGGARREVEFRPGEGGEVYSVYRLDGRETEFDAAAQDWFAGVLDTLIRRTGIGAEARARRLLTEGGPEAVLDELPRLESSTAQAAYVGALLSEERFGGDLVRRTAEIVGRTVSSSSTAGELLRALAAFERDDEALTRTLIEASEAISSSSTRGQLLEELARGRPLTPDLASRMMRSAEGISSSSTSSQALKVILEHSPADPEVHRTYLAAADSISSTSSRQEAYEALIRRGALPQSTWLRMVKGIEEFSSSSTRTELLVRVLDEAPGDPALYSAVLDAIDGTPSTSSQQRAMEALLKRPDLDKATLKKAADVAGDISSSSTRAELLEEILELSLELE